VFTRCIFCHTPLPANETLEHFRHGRKVAFDAARGRLWAICTACSRWNLAPIEERWEALDELEKVTRDRARLLSQTDNIALLRAGDLELVRVGRAQLTEEAWWRYGRDLQQRRKRSYLLQGVEAVALIAAAVATGGAMVGFYGTGASVSLARRWRFGRVAWKGSLACPLCGGLLEEIRFSQTGSLILLRGDEGQVVVRYRCRRCGDAHGHPPPAGYGDHLFTGTAAEHLLRRSLAWQHFSGASEKRVREATQAIEHAGSVERLTKRIAARSIRLDALEKDHRTESVALEIAVNEETERRLLEMELAQLERRWKEEEEIAAIADRELSFLPGLDRFLGRASSAG
jgi:hypothetical protein